MASNNLQPASFRLMPQQPSAELNDDLVYHRHARTPPSRGFFLENSTETPSSSAWLPHLKMLLIVGLSVTTMGLDHQHAMGLNEVRQLLVGAMTPIQQLAQLPLQTVHFWEQALSEQTALREENQRQLLLQQTQLHRLSELEAENRRLRRLLGSTVDSPSHTGLIARIVRVEQNPHRPRLLLDKGERHGVVVGQPLVDADGLVGQIEAVYPFTSRAILISDIHHSMQLQVVRNGLRTLATGTGRRGVLALDHVLYDQDIRPGDLLVTSGLDDLYPGGYSVARVVEVEADPGQSFARITAAPLSALNQLREVLLLRPLTKPADPAALEH